MRHSWTTGPEGRTTVYEWKLHRWHHFSVESATTAVPFGPESEEAFITEHYWGYNRLGPGRSMEYQVEHPTWKAFPVRGARIDVDFGVLYGSAFAFLQGRTPESVLLAEGSPVIVRSGRLLT